MKAKPIESLGVRKMDNGWLVTFILAGSKSREVYLETWAAVHDFVSKLLAR